MASRNARIAWRVGGSIVAVLALGWGTLNAVGALAHETVHTHNEYTGTVHTVDVQASNGSVRIQRTSGSAVIVDAVVSKGLQSPSNDQSLAGDHLIIRSGCDAFSIGPFCGVDYTIQVPQSSSGSGPPVTLDISTSRGDISIGDVSADTMRLSSSDGDINALGFVADSAAASSSRGSITLTPARPPSRITADCSDGSIDIALPQTQDAYQVHVSSSHGSATAPIKTDPASSRVIQASSSNGDVTVRYAP
jgi:hypothetical protein